MHGANSKSTNGRLIAPLLASSALALALAGCSALPLAAARAECGVGLQAVCTSFGPASSCECVPRTEVDRFLTTFGEPDWLGGVR